MLTCKKCPPEVKGTCCYFSCLLEGYNIILENKPCELLDLETKMCKDYKHRNEKIPYCLKGKNMFEKGGLPEGCLYLKKEKGKEINPKIKIHSVINKLNPISIGYYNFMNNHPNLKELYVESIKHDNSILQ